MTMIVGHRGARNLWPENSLTGFRNLLDLPVQAVEFDVHLTRAGELLVMHDATLDRTSDRTGPVADLGIGERHDVRLHGSSEGIPTLDEVLRIYAPTGLELHVELKSDADGLPYQGLEAQAVALIDAHHMCERALLTSFTPGVLAKVRSLAPHIRTLLSFHRKSADQQGLVEGLKTGLAVADIIAVEKTLLAQDWDIITALVSRERLGVWTPNSQEDLDHWMSRGLRQITTDRPDIALAVREDLHASS
jgi:glycerophosphoryl diester phosphodiesterase